ncbi:MAG: hypothetical protein A2293_14390 [Elusimicrobia bacterium RIFOXYB2_FULL_49_7]|nr:MAG: hypothetical protein A2293_14390 [Elusimicrobia bacterium RIFOXYB2_FULL_49_7]
MDIKNRMEEMINAGDRFIAVNLVQVEYMHSFFIKILTITYKKLRASGGDLVLIAPNSFIKELIQLLNLQEFITLFNSELSLADYLKSG